MYTGRIHVICFMTYAVFVSQVAGQCNGTAEVLHTSLFSTLLVQSPGSLNGYDRNLSCRWMINMRFDSSTVYIKGYFFGLQSGHDVVRVYNGGNGTDHKLMDSSVNPSPSRIATVTVETTAVLVIFTTDDVTSNDGAGFNIEIMEALDFSGNGCPGPSVLEATDTKQYITSPQFPRTYGSNVDCRWTLTSSPSSVVNITVLFIDLDYSGSTCYHYLRIEGFGEFCQPVEKNEMPHYSSAEINIVFHADNVNSKVGFIVQYVRNNLTLEDTTTFMVTTSESSNRHQAVNLQTTYTSEGSTSSLTSQQTRTMPVTLLTQEVTTGLASLTPSGSSSESTLASTFSSEKTQTERMSTVPLNKETVQTTGNTVTSVISERTTTLPRLVQTSLPTSDQISLISTLYTTTKLTTLTSEKYTTLKTTYETTTQIPTSERPSKYQINENTSSYLTSGFSSIKTMPTIQAGGAMFAYSMGEGTSTLQSSYLYKSTPNSRTDLTSTAIERQAQNINETLDQNTKTTLEQSTIDTTLHQSTIATTVDQSTIATSPAHSTIDTTVDHSTIKTTLDHSTLKTTLDHSTTETTVDQSTIKTTPDQSTTETTSDESTTEKTLDHSTTETTPDQSTTETTSDQSTTETTPDQSTTETTPDQSTTETKPDQSTIETTIDQSTIETTLDHSTTETTADQSTIEITHKQSTIKTTLDHSTIETTIDQSTIETTLDHSTIETTPNQSTIETTLDHSTIKTTPDQSTTETTTDQSTTETTPDDSTIETTSDRYAIISTHDITSNQPTIKTTSDRNGFVGSTHSNITITSNVMPKLNTFLTNKPEIKITTADMTIVKLSTVPLIVTKMTVGEMRSISSAESVKPDHGSANTPSSVQNYNDLTTDQFEKKTEKVEETYGLIDTSANNNPEGPLVGILISGILAVIVLVVIICVIIYTCCLRKYIRKSNLARLRSPKVSMPSSRNSFSDQTIIPRWVSMLDAFRLSGYIPTFQPSNEP